MTGIIWADIKKRLIPPFLDIDLKYYDLSVQHLELPAQAQVGQPRPVRVAAAAWIGKAIL